MIMLFHVKHNLNKACLRVTRAFVSLSPQQNQHDVDVAR